MAGEGGLCACMPCVQIVFLGFGAHESWLPPHKGTFAMLAEHLADALQHLGTFLVGRVRFLFLHLILGFVYLPLFVHFFRAGSILDQEHNSEMHV